MSSSPGKRAHQTRIPVRTTTPNAGERGSPAKAANSGSRLIHGTRSSVITALDSMEVAMGDTTATLSKFKDDDKEWTTIERTMFIERFDRLEQGTPILALSTLEYYKTTTKNTPHIPALCFAQLCVQLVRIHNDGNSLLTGLKSTIMADSQDAGGGEHTPQTDFAGLPCKVIDGKNYYEEKIVDYLQKKDNEQITTLLQDNERLIMRINTLEKTQAEKDEAARDVALELAGVRQELKTMFEGHQRFVAEHEADAKAVRNKAAVDKKREDRYYIISQDNLQLKNELRELKASAQWKIQTARGERDKFEARNAEFSALKSQNKELLDKYQKIEKFYEQYTRGQGDLSDQLEKIQAMTEDTSEAVSWKHNGAAPDRPTLSDELDGLQGSDTSDNDSGDESVHGDDVEPRLRSKTNSTLGQAQDRESSEFLVTNDQLKDDVAYLQGEVDRLKAELADRVAQSDQAVTAAPDLAQKLEENDATHQNTIARLQDEIDSNTQRISSLQEEKLRSEQSLADAVKRLETSRLQGIEEHQRQHGEDHSKTVADPSDAQTSATEVGQQLVECNESKAKLEQQIGNLREKTNQLEKQAVDLQKASSKKNSQYEDAIAKIAEEQKATQVALAEKTKQHSETLQQLQNVQKTPSLPDTAACLECAKLKKVIAEQEQQLSTQQKSSDDELRNILSELNSAEGALAELQATRNVIEETVTTATANLNTAVVQRDAQSVKAATLAKEVSELKVTEAEAKQQCKLVEARADAIAAEQEKLHKAALVAKDALIEAASKNQGNSSQGVADKLAACEESKEHMAQALAKSQESNHQLEKNFAENEISKQLNTERATAKEAEGKLAAVQKEQDFLKTRVRELQQGSDEARAEVVHGRKQQQSLQESYDKLQQKIVDSDATIAALRSQMSTATKAKAELEATVTTLHSQISTLTPGKAELHATIADLRSQVSTATAEREELQYSFDDYQRVVKEDTSVYNAQVVYAQKELDRMHTDNKWLTDLNNEKDEQITRMYAEVREKQQRLSGYEKEAEVYNEAADDIEAQLAVLANDEKQLRERLYVAEKASYELQRQYDACKVEKDALEARVEKAMGESLTGENGHSMGTSLQLSAAERELVVLEGRLRRAINDRDEAKSRSLELEARLAEAQTALRTRRNSETLRLARNRPVTSLITRWGLDVEPVYASISDPSTAAALMASLLLLFLGVMMMWGFEQRRLRDMWLTANDDTYTMVRNGMQNHQNSGVLADLLPTPMWVMRIQYWLTQKLEFDRSYPG